MTGAVFNIQRFCVQDGDGLRTTVFLKGCPLRCAWCHNPESHKSEKEIFFSAEKCIFCGACAQVCGRHSLMENVHRFDRTGCIGCGKCAENCFAGALETCGKTMTVEEVLDIVLRDKEFYGTEGGLTLSGGEPTLQAEFCIALAKGAKQHGLHVAVETCGACSRETLMELARCTDLFLYDVKVLDDALHRQYTGASNRALLENLYALAETGARIILRCPVIPDVNLNDAHFDGVAALAQRVGAQEVQFEPYHPLGVSKAQRLDRKTEYDKPEFLDRAVVQAYVDRAAVKSTVKLVIQ